MLPQRDGLATFDAADQWIKSQSGQRYFLFLQVAARSADAVVGRVVEELKRTRRYNDSTIVLTADYGDPSSGATLSSKHVTDGVKRILQRYGSSLKGG